MSKGRKNWIVVDLDGLRMVLIRRGKKFVIFELVQNCLDENVTRVDIELTRPSRGKSQLTVTDDSPEGFRDLTDAYTMFAESYKKSNPEKRGAFNVGEKYVLALCNEASISTTTGQVTFNGEGRIHNERIKRAVGSEFRGTLPLTEAEWEEMCEAVKLVIPSVPVYFNGKLIAQRKPLRTWDATLETVKSDGDGSLRRTERKTTISIYKPQPLEPAYLYEMGIPVVQINAKFHVNVGQKVPLNVDRDNVKPSYLRTIYVELLNHTADIIDDGDATENWVRTAAGDPRCSSEAIKTVLDLRFGEDRVSYDMNDVGSNREAASKNFTVVTGGSLSKGEWENAKRAEAIQPAGVVFPTNLGAGKVAEKEYERREWTAEMEEYANFVADVSRHLIGRNISVRYIRDRSIPLCGSFVPAMSQMTVNLAWHKIGDWRNDIDLMIHELAHETVQSNDHLVHSFYDATCKLGAKLTLLAVERSELFNCMRVAVAEK